MKLMRKQTETNYPSSMGLTCKVKGSTAEIKLEVEYAKYSKIDAKKWIFQRTPIRDSENKIISIPLKLIEGASKLIPIGDNTVSINYHIRKIDSNFMISVFLRNNLKQNSEKQDPALCIYQPVIRLVAKKS